MLARAEQPLLQRGEARPRGELAGVAAAVAAHGRRDGGGLRVVAARGHDPGGPEGDVADAHGPAAQEQVLDVAAVERPVRDGVHALRVPLRAAAALAVDAVGGVQVDRPTPEAHGVVVALLLDDVPLVKEEVALEAAALALAGDRAHPLQRQVRRLGEVAAVLEVIPHRVHHPPQLPLDLLGGVHGVEAAAVLDPPQLAAVLLRVERAVPRDSLDVVEGEGRLHERHRLAHVLRVEVQRVAEQAAVRLVGREALVELFSRLGSDPEGRAREEADDAVARGVEEPRRPHPVARGVLAAERCDGGDPVRAAFLYLVDDGVEQQADVGLRHHQVQQHRVEEHRVALGVAVQILDHQLVDEAALPSPPVVVAQVRRGAEHPQADLAGRVAAKHRPVLHQHDAEPLPRRGHRGAAAGDAAADDGQVGVEFLLAELTIGTGFEVLHGERKDARPAEGGSKRRFGANISGDAGRRLDLRFAGGEGPTIGTGRSGLASVPRRPRTGRTRRAGSP